MVYSVVNLTHLKHFALNAAKNFINGFPNTTTVN